MERSYEGAAALVLGAAGPLAAHLDLFVTSLINKQYVVDVVYVKARHILAFDRWLAKHRVVLGDLGEVHVEQYQHRNRRRRRYIRTETRRRELCDLTQLLHFLRVQGVCGPVSSNFTPAADLAAEFEHYLQHQKGLANASVDRYKTTAWQFLAERFGRGEVDLSALRPADTIEFIQRQTKRMQPQSLKNIVSGLRSFLRYAQYRGEIAAGLVFVVPGVATWASTPKLPRAISPEHAQRALDSCDLGTAVGLRDRAVLVILARLGLRAHEIIALQLQDIDWDTGQLRVRGKGRRECLLPMPIDVGEAIAVYLERGRPASDDRHVFLRAMAPICGLMEGSDAIGSIVRYALKRAKVDAPHSGSHQFRHALAVRMLQGGASLPEIGEVLRHRSPQTTSIYARVDINSLRSLAPAWPGGAQ
ncbi:MAG: site-specific integrase [Acidimicrobiales bacterium]